MATQPGLLDECIILDSAIQSITSYAHQARRDLDKQHIAQAINSISLVCQHLRTTSLPPDLYGDLWQRTTELLMEFENNFDDISTIQPTDAVTPLSIEKIHEVVQYCADIIPRLYLTITVASSLIKTRRVPCKNVLFDLTELCRGVQQPIHGLFLRSYLSLMTKDKLPDIGTVYHQPGYHGEVTDAIEFVLENFSQMNRLWVRMQHQGTVRDKSKRERHRRTLQSLVGSNLYRLSDLQGLTFQLYKEHVLPRLLDDIVNCKDVLAQEFLMDCIIQAFSDEFQIGTVELFLNATTQLHEKVNIQKLVTALLNRLSKFGQALLEGQVSLRDLTDKECGLQRLQQLFPLISTTVRDLTTTRSLTLSNIIEFNGTLLEYISVIHTDRLDYIDTVLENTILILKERKGDYHLYDKELNQMLLQLISAPIQQLKLKFFQLTNVPPLVTLLTNSTKRSLAYATCEALLKSSHGKDKDAKKDAAAAAAAAATEGGATTVADLSTITTSDNMITEVGVADALFSLLRPLTRNDGDNEEDGSADGTFAPVQYNDDGSPKQDTGSLEPYQMEANFTYVSRIVHLISADNLDVFFKMLLTARKYLGQGIPSSLSLTLTPVIIRAFKLARTLYKMENDPNPEAKGTTQLRTKRVLHFIHETLQEFVKYDSQQGLRLYVQAALLSDALHMEAISYEFVVQAFLTYEEKISDNKLRLQPLLYVMAHLPQLQNWSKDNYDNISQACFRHANAIMIKADQAKCLAHCSHLHWVVSPEVLAEAIQTGEPIPTTDPETNEVIPQRNADKVLAYLRKSLNIARDCVGHQTVLFVEILNKYIFFYLQKCPTTELDHIIGLTQIIIDAVTPLIEQGVHRQNSKDNTQRGTLMYFKHTLKYMIQRDVITEASPLFASCNSIIEQL